MTVAKLVEVFQANGISLEINERKCETPRSSQSHATNQGPTGLESRDEITRVEGDVLCHVDRSGISREVVVVKYPTDRETKFGVLNVSCSLYPYDTSVEREQVSRVENALRELVRAIPEG